MGFFGFVALVIGGAALWLAFWRAYYRTPECQDEIHFTTTSDGWRLALSRFRPAPGSPKRAHPVVLCPGVGANRHGYCASPETSLARFLASQGYDCWVLELRGIGLSEGPNPFQDRHYGWTLDDHVQKDVPAAIERVREATGARKVHWVGHSMGGILLYLALLRPGAERIASGVTIGSSLDYHASGSDFDRLIKLKPLLSWLPAVPVGWAMTAIAPFSGRWETFIDKFNFNSIHSDGLTYRRLLAHGWNAVSGPVFWQLETAFLPGGIRSADGTVRYSERLSQVRTPLYVVAGCADRQCSAAASKRTFDRLGSPEKKYVEYDGHAHFDLLIGRDATRNIFPGIADWLGRFDARD